MLPTPEFFVLCDNGLKVVRTRDFDLLMTFYMHCEMQMGPVDLQQDQQIKRLGVFPIGPYGFLLIRMPHEQFTAETTPLMSETDSCFFL